MPTKIQTFGIDKYRLIKFHQELLENKVGELKNSIPDEKLKEFTDFASLHSRVIMFGLSEIDNLDLSYKTAIYTSFDPSYDGLNEFIQKESKNRSYEGFSDWLIDRLKFAERFFTREELSDKVESEFLKIIETLETFLQAEFAKVLLPLLIKIEDETKAEISRIYELDLSPEEKENLAFEFLKQKEQESIKLFEGEILQKLNDKSYTQFLLVLALLNLPEPDKKIIDTELKKAKFGYTSNIEAFFKNSFRRVKETVFENLYTQRSLETDQAKEISFNKNDFKLSLLAHPRAYFRGLVYVASKDKTDRFKMVVPPSVEPSLNPSGMTKKYLGQTKTLDEWSKVNGLGNINVVNGLGLHHGSQEYYLPGL